MAVRLPYYLQYTANGPSDPNSSLYTVNKDTNERELAQFAYQPAPDDMQLPWVRYKQFSLEREIAPTDFFGPAASGKSIDISRPDGSDVLYDYIELVIFFCAPKRIPSRAELAKLLARPRINFY